MPSSTLLGTFQPIENYSLDELAQFIRVHIGGWNDQNQAFRDGLLARDPTIEAVTYVLSSEVHALRPGEEAHRPFRSNWCFRIYNRQRVATDRCVRLSAPVPQGATSMAVQATNFALSNGETLNFDGLGAVTLRASASAGATTILINAAPFPIAGGAYGTLASWVDNIYYDPGASYPSDWEELDARSLATGANVDAWFLHLKPYDQLPASLVVNGVTYNKNPAIASWTKVQRRLHEDGNPTVYHMHHGNSAWQDWVQARAAGFREGFLQTYGANAGVRDKPFFGGKGFYLDNVWVGWQGLQSKAMRIAYGVSGWNNGLPAHVSLIEEYPNKPDDEEVFRQDMIELIRHVRAGLDADTPIWGNLYSALKNGSSMNPYFIDTDGKRLITGGLNETFATDFPATESFLDVSEMDGDLTQVEWIADQEAKTLVFPQGPKWEKKGPTSSISTVNNYMEVEPTRLRVSHAAYFLVLPAANAKKKPLLTFRYSDSTDYRNFYFYTGYELDLGGAVTPRYKFRFVVTDPYDPWYTDGVTPLTVWRRDFANGNVMLSQTRVSYAWYDHDLNPATPEILVETIGDGRIVLTTQPGMKQLGTSSVGGTAVEVPSDTIITRSVTLAEPGRMIRVWAYVDGLGSGAGTDQALRAVVFKRTGSSLTLVKSGVGVSIPKNMTGRLVELTFEIGTDWTPGEYEIGLQTGKANTQPTATATSLIRLRHDGATGATRGRSWSETWGDGSGNRTVAAVPINRNTSTTTPHSQRYTIYVEYVAEGVPLAPSNLRASGVTLGRIDLRWNNNAADALAVELERSTSSLDDPGGMVWTRIARVGPRTANYVDTGLLDNVEYHYRVRAINTSYPSSWSNVGSAINWDAQTDFRAGTSKFGGSATTLSMTIPDTVKAGDLILAMVSNRPYAFNNAGEVATVTTPSGWTALTNGVMNFTQRISWFWRVATGADAGATVNFSVSNGIAVNMSGALVAYFNVDGAAPITTFSTPLWSRTGSSASPPTPGGDEYVQGDSITTLVNRERVVFMGFVHSGSEAFDELTDGANAPTKMVTRVSKIAIGDAAGAISPYVADEAWPRPSATGARRAHFDTSGENSSAMGLIVGLKPKLVAPAAPTGLTATETSGQVLLAWTDNAENETAFTIERSRDAGATWQPVANLYANNRASVSFPDRFARPSTSYQYRVKAFNRSGESAYSGVASITTSADLAQPTLGHVEIAPVLSPGDGYRFRVVPDSYAPHHERPQALLVDANGGIHVDQAPNVAMRYEATLWMRGAEDEEGFGTWYDLDAHCAQSEPVWYWGSDLEEPVQALVAQWQREMAGRALTGGRAAFTVPLEIITL